MKSANPLKPSPQLLAKIGSAAAHAQEALGPDGHHFDKIALDGLLNDPQVKEWMAQMRAIAMISEPRRK